MFTGTSKGYSWSQSFKVESFSSESSDWKVGAMALSLDGSSLHPLPPETFRNRILQEPHGPSLGPWKSQVNVSQRNCSGRTGTGFTQRKEGGRTDCSLDLLCALRGRTIDSKQKVNMVPAKQTGDPWRASPSIRTLKPCSGMSRKKFGRSSSLNTGHLDLCAACAAWSEKHSSQLLALQFSEEAQVLSHS